MKIWHDMETDEMDIPSDKVFSAGVVIACVVLGAICVLAAVAKACGCENVIECRAEETATVVQEALDSDKMTIIVCKCESGNIKVPVIDIDPVVIKDRFMKEVQSRNDN